MDVYAMYREPSWENAGWLALDVVLWAVPYVPAVGGVVGRAGRLAISHADEAADVVRAVTQVASHADEFADTLRAANRLTELGTHSDEATDVIRALAEASTRNRRVQGGCTVLGSFPEYTDIARLEGLTYFDMPSEAWQMLSEAGEEYVWAVNRQFLDDSIAAGHNFVVVLGEGRTPGRYLQREIQYLLDNGYEWVDGILVRR